VPVLDGLERRFMAGGNWLTILERSLGDSMRKVYGFTWVTVAVMCIYIGWIFFSRWSENRALIRRLEEGKAAQDRAVVEAYGGGRLTILGFYATPTTIHTGKTAQLCYSVSNAESVRIEPPVENVWPSLSRCVEVAPSSDTVYKLIAEDSKGNAKTASVIVKVN
jgi:hypothetical protein